MSETKPKKNDFKELLKKVDMNGAQLSRRIGVSVSAVSAWASGKSNPSYKRITDIANALKVTQEEVLQCFI
jgi:transcriptional regulator with XRE-family HTH domain